MADQQAFRDCLTNVCGLRGAEATAIANQGYNTGRTFRRIDKDSLTELFAANNALSTMRVARKQNLRALRAWLQECDPEAIDLTLFTDEALEAQCNVMSSLRRRLVQERATSLKTSHPHGVETSSSSAFG